MKESYEEAQERADALIGTYKLPVVVEQFIVGPEITVVAFDDGEQVHIFCAQKVFKESESRKYLFTSFESDHHLDPTITSRPTLLSPRR